MSHEVLITRRQSIFNFFADPGRGGPQKAGACWCLLVLVVLDAEACLCLDLQKNQKWFVSWLSGPHGTSNFDHQSLIHSYLNYTNHHCCIAIALFSVFPYHSGNEIIEVLIGKQTTLFLWRSSLHWKKIKGKKSMQKVVDLQYIHHRK